MPSTRWLTLLLWLGIHLSTPLSWGATAPDPPVPERWKHPDGWRKPDQHGARFAAKPDECRACHGKDLKGGVSRTGCGGCHATSAHQPRIDFSMTHPRKVKQASGFTMCQTCHGTDFAGTVLSNGQGCMATSTCHFHQDGMPHDPWNGRSLDFIQHTHTDTDQSNAPVCGTCHNRVTIHRWYDAKGKPVTYGNLLQPPAGAPSGTAPGCFNSTLCHDRELPSPRPRQ